MNTVCEPSAAAYIASLQKVSNYARSLGISTVEVYRRIGAGKLAGTKIDGVFFVVLQAAA